MQGFGPAPDLGSWLDPPTPVRGIVATATGAGYRLFTAGGASTTFGDATFRGDLRSVHLNKPMAGLINYGNGYLLVGSDGGIFNFSSLQFAGSLGDRPPASPVVGVAALP